MFKHFDWQQVALLAEDGQEFPEYHTYLEDLFLTEGISVVYQRKMPRQATPEDAVKVHTLTLSIYISIYVSVFVSQLLIPNLVESSLATPCSKYQIKLFILNHHSLYWGGGANCRGVSLFLQIREGEYLIRLPSLRER